MNAIKRTFILVATLFAATVLADDSAVDVDTLFNDDFEPTQAPTINDPIQKVNRIIFRFNDEIYTDFAKPFAKFYRKNMPSPVQNGIANFFHNAKFPSRFVGSVLQGKMKRAGKETGKFLVNTTVGIGGLFNATKDMDNLKTADDEDFGQAFAKWGIGHGFYIVLPLIGPTSLRDLAGNYGDHTVEPIPTPYSQIDNTATRFTMRVIDNVNELPFILDLYDSMKRTAIDPYTAVRDAYAQQRATAVAR